MTGTVEKRGWTVWATSALKAALKMAVAAGVVLLPIMVTRAAAAQSYSVIHTFDGGDGGSPDSTLIADASGNLYGTGGEGGNYPFGTVYEILATGSETMLYGFPGGADGEAPNGGLIRDAAGNIYGTTLRGGNYGGKCTLLYGCGLVYELDPQGNETVLYRFVGGSDGAAPQGGLIQDSHGNFYGTTVWGGNFGGLCAGIGCGVIFKLDRFGNETMLHRFSRTDGAGPSGLLVADSSGNLFGTTGNGGGSGCFGLGCGVVFKIDPAGNETVLHAFTGGADGGGPADGLVLDPVGNLYGTTATGGHPYCGRGVGCGVVFKVDPAGNETVLREFTGGGDGGNPVSGLIRDNAGNMYGTTEFGGSVAGRCVDYNGCGVVFKLTPTGNEILLRTFDDAEGSLPVAALLPLNGYLYGTASSGGTYLQGVVFKLQP